MLRITELKLPIDHPEEDLRPAILQRLGIASDDLLDFTLFKRSYDARKKSSELCFIYTIDLTAKDEAALLHKFADDRNVNVAPDVSYKVVGQAPAGGSGRGVTSVTISSAIPYSSGSAPATTPPVRLMCSTPGPISLA